VTGVSVGVTMIWVLGAIGAALPDVDAIGFRLGVPYDSAIGHRGVTRSLMFAALFAAACLPLFDRGERRRVWLQLFLATASHGVLDESKGSESFEIGLEINGPRGQNP
jgi:membrane-bound metal-dependent hydrolase YbcI (DUF457 family)